MACEWWYSCLGQQYSVTSEWKIENFLHSQPAMKIKKNNKEKYGFVFIFYNSVSSIRQKPEALSGYSAVRWLLENTWYLLLPSLTSGPFVIVILPINKRE